MHCPYCGEDRTEITEEHVLPRALGGGLVPENPFKLTVCLRCNGACGRYVDAPFIRSWLIHNARAQAEREAIDFASSPVLPLMFMGRDTGWTDANVQCDFWLGPTGDHVYHFHRPYPGEPALVGRPPHLRPEALDPGFAFVAITATNPVWHPIIFRSIQAALDGTPIVYLNTAPRGSKPPWPTVPREWQSQFEWVSQQGASMREVEAEHELGCEERFIAKLALGFGNLFLAPSFTSSPDAHMLRRALWTQDRAGRAEIELRGSGLFSGAEDFEEIFGWKGCHLLGLVPFGDALALIANFYGRHKVVLRMATDPALWVEKLGSRPDEGKIWVVAPGLRRFAGPMRLSTYIAEKYPPRRRAGQLAELEKMIDALPPRPPFRLPGDGESGRA